MMIKRLPQHLVYLAACLVTYLDGVPGITQKLTIQPIHNMYKYCLIALLFLLPATKGFSQYTIRELDKDDDRPSGGLAKNEILVVGLISPACLVQCSADKSQWKKWKLRYESTIEVTLNEDYAYLYIQIVDGTGDAEKKYRLAPGRKYKLTRDRDSGDVIIKAGN